MIFVKRFFLVLLLIILPINSMAHQSQEERMKFWKEYYNPKLEVTQPAVPSVKINLNKIGPFFQLQTNVGNFKLTPDQDMKNDNTWTGYGKLFINGKFITRIYNKYLFLKSIPIGENEIKVILSSNMDADLTYRNEIISDSIIIRFPEYNFAEARSKAYGLYIQCEFSDNGQKNKTKLANKGLAVSESSEFLQCRHDSQKNTLDSFKKEMSKIQLAHYEITLDAFQKRIKLWKSFENNEINISNARKKNILIENNIDIQMQEKISQGSKK